MSPHAATVVADQPSDAARFSVRARAEPGVMPRLMELFAKRGLVPSAWHAVERAPAELAIDIEMRGLGGEAIEYIAACMRQIASVDVVLASATPLGRGE